MSGAQRPPKPESADDANGFRHTAGMEGTEGRRIRVVLCTPDGRLLGSLPPLDVSTPWWRDTTEPVIAVRDTYGLDVTILRLLSVDGNGDAARSSLTVLAQLDAQVDLGPIVEPRSASSGFEDVLADHPLRQAYARPGGPDADLAWADAALEARGTPRVARPEQERTWNLSSIWRLPTRDGDAWLKAVPPFFAHEGAMIEVVRSALPAVPQVLARDGRRVLLADVPGVDQYDAPVHVRAAMVRALVAAQSALAGSLDAMLATGCFDWRPDSFIHLAQDVVARNGGELDAGTRAALEDLVDGLPARFEELAACGIPDTLVHGDFHAGNVRGDDAHLVFLDWGDSGVGHPLLDQAAFLETTGSGDRAAIAAVWTSAWRSAIPSCDAVRAATVIRPIAGLRQAVLYQLFLDRIEPSERVYHERDPLTWLHHTARALRPGEGSPV